MTKIHVLTCFGTRPEAIKMAPVVLALQRDPAFDVTVVVSAQHRQMLDQVLKVFKIDPDFDLNVMKPNQSLDEITSNVILSLGKVLDREKPDIVLVHGDTTTTLAASLAAFYHRTRIGHVEAGLRTWNKYSPYPEELNRQMTDDLTDLYFAPTEQSCNNLLQQHHNKENIFITGNTAIDALKLTVDENYHHSVLDLIQPKHRVILMTMHRRENQGKPMEAVFAAVRDVVKSHEDIEVIYPVHLNPIVQETAATMLGNQERIHLVDPLDVVDFHNLAARSFFIMTDSGGVQEEAPSLGKPVLVLRDTTERPEGVTAGTLKLVGTRYESVLDEMEKLIEDTNEYHRMSNAMNPYGDGRATERILDALKYYFNLRSKRPQDFVN